MTNVVVITTDQQSASAMSAAGNPWVHTPHLDRLAAEGMRFDRAYCAAPLCGPSRASLWTGRTPTEVGARDNGVPLRPEDQQRTLGNVVRAAGYDCAYAGKWHVPELSVPAWSGFEAIHPEREAGIVDSVGDYLRRDHDRPYLLVVSLTEPHGICQWARGQQPPSGHLDEPDFDDLPALPDNYARPAHEAELPLVARERTPHANPIAGWDEADWRRYLYGYHRLCERVDATVGALLALVDELSGPDTVVIVSSDHGDQMAAHQWNQKWVLYEESVRVPLIIRGPGVRTGVSDSLVNIGMDVYPTICELTGADPGPLPDGPAAPPGRSLLPELTGTTSPGEGAPTGPSEIFVETRWDVADVGHLTGRAAIGRRFKYTCYAWGRHREQLVDLEADPGEMQNLAFHPHHRDELARGRTLVADHARAVGDHKFAAMVPAPRARPR